MKNFILRTAALIFLFLLLPVFLPTEASAQIRINEIAWMGTDDSAHDEWMELYNFATSDIDLTGWQVVAEDESPTITLEGVVDGESYFLLERTDDNSVPGVSMDQKYTGALNNEGKEILTLKNGQGKVVESFDFSAGWPAGDKDTKQTMERAAEDAWQTSAEPGGTPKAPNSSGGETQDTEDDSSSQETASNLPVSSNNAPSVKIISPASTPLGEELTLNSEASDPDGDPLAYFWNFGDGETSKETRPTHTFSSPGEKIITLEVSDDNLATVDTILISVLPTKIMISEFLPSPAGKDAEEEFVEIFNPYGFVVNISGWQIDDSKKGSNAFTIPAHTKIAPFSYLALRRPLTKIALNNDNDKVRLIYPTDEVAQEISYKEAPEGWSGVLQKDNFVWSAMPTPGTENVLSLSQKETPKKDVLSYNTKSETPAIHLSTTQTNTAAPDNIVKNKLNQSAQTAKTKSGPTREAKEASIAKSAAGINFPPSLPLAAAIAAGITILSIILRKFIKRKTS